MKKEGEEEDRVRKIEREKHKESMRGKEYKEIYEEREREGDREREREIN
jgi:hypothetical protein